MIKFIFILFFLPLFLNAQSAFISGNDTICDNSPPAAIQVDFSGVAPYTFSYSINGEKQPTVNTTINPYLIHTKEDGLYLLEQYNDAFNEGSVSGSALLKLIESPISNIHLESESLSFINPIANFICKSTGNIISWEWNFGDNTPNNFDKDTYHQYKDSLTVYQSSLIVSDVNGCVDTSFQTVVITDLYWFYLPNSFSPDNDGVNDKFCIEFNGIFDETFFFNIYNTMGDLIFQSSNPYELSCEGNGGWDGSNYLSGEYIYTISYQDFEMRKYNNSGLILLLR